MAARLSSPDAVEIAELVDDALHGHELTPDETAAMLSFANEEVPHLLSPQRSYLVLGSFEDPYLRRVRVVVDELNRRFSSYAFTLGDLRELDLDRIPSFLVRFAIVATYADVIAAVFEHDAGGTSTELGMISKVPLFEKSHVLPRDYAWLTGEHLGSVADLIAAVVSVLSSGDIADETRQREIQRLVDAAQSGGLEVAIDEVVDAANERLSNDDVSSYSWVHLSAFRLFELHDRCHPWIDRETLREAVGYVP